MSTRCILPAEKPCSSPSTRVARRRSAAILPVSLLVACSLAGGCSDAQKRKWKHRSAEQNLTTALESKRADERRDAVVRIGESSYYAGEDAFHVLDAVARTDPATQVRCIAVRTLARYEDERPVKTLMLILGAEGSGGEAIPADDDLRWETAKALLAFRRRGMLTDEQQGAACETCIKLLQSDRSRNVRLTCAEALGTFKDKRVLSPLINALRSDDFMLADTAERSLAGLTGVSHDYNADAWTKWVAETADPFAHAGEPVASTQPAGPTWWDKQERVWRKAIKLQVD